MYAQSRGQRSYDIPSLPMSMLKQKYEQTYDAYDDPQTVENFMKETLRYNGSDAPLFESDMPRSSRNAMSQSILNMQEHGGRYTHAPFHPELFLGDLTKDQRMSTTQPLTAQLADQHSFRHKRYIHGKLQDVGDERYEGIVGTKRMLKQVRQGHDDTATRMGGIFNDSINTMSSKANPNPGSTIHKVGPVIHEDQNIYEVNGEKILPQYSQDIVGKLSNMIGVQWDVQPEAKYGLSSVSNVYRSKQDVDSAANAVFRLGVQDTSFKDGRNTIKNSEKVYQVANLKNAKINLQSVEVNTNGKSIQNVVARKMMPPSDPVNKVSMYAGTQQMKDQVHNVALRHRQTGQQKYTESLVETLTNRTVISATRGCAVPVKDQTAIQYKVNRSDKQNHRNEDIQSKRSIGLKNIINAPITRASGVYELLKRVDQQNVVYTNTTLPKNIDHVKNVKLTQSKVTTKEQMNVNATGSNVIPQVQSMKNFEFDTDPTMNNNYITRRGLRQQMTKLSSKQEYDNEISPVNDTIAPYKTNYTKQ